MELREYLPSGKYLAVLFSLLVSSGLIAYAARASTTGQQGGAVYAVQTGSGSTQDLSVANPNWQNAFVGDTVPQQMADIQSAADQLSSTTQTKSLTESIGRSLLLQTGSLQQQGIAESASAQNQAVSQALSQIQSAQTASRIYTASNFRVLPYSSDTVHTYGNSLFQTVASYPFTYSSVALVTIGAAVDSGAPSDFAKIATIGRSYAALAKAIANLPTPNSFLPAAEQLANQYQQMADACASIANISTDPAKGLAGVEEYNSISTANSSTILQIAGRFQTSGIVFKTGEWGTGWAEGLAVYEQKTQLQAQLSVSTAVPSSSLHTSGLNVLSQ